jgi:hypothetical protein
VRADDRNLGKVAVQAFHFGQAPVFDIQNHDFRKLLSNGVPQFFAGPGQAHREVRAKSTGQGMGDCGVFLENNDGLNHTSPDLEPWSTAAVMQNGRRQSRLD